MYLNSDLGSNVIIEQFIANIVLLLHRVATVSGGLANTL